MFRNVRLIFNQKKFYHQTNKFIYVQRKFNTNKQFEYIKQKNYTYHKKINNMNNAKIKNNDNNILELIVGIFAGIGIVSSTLYFINWTNCYSKKYIVV